MRILIVTHVSIRSAGAPERLLPEQRGELESRASTIYLSSVSTAEIMIRASLGKLRFDHDVIGCAEQLGFELLSFPRRTRDRPFHRRDPFDRMLVVQSMARNTRLMSADRRFADCSGHNSCLKQQHWG